MRHIIAINLLLLLSVATAINVDAQNLLEEGEYRVYTTQNGINYFLTDNGSLTVETDNDTERQTWIIAPYRSTSGSELNSVAYTFINKSTGNYFEDGGHLQGYDESVWTSHAMRRDAVTGAYAIRMTNNASQLYNGQYYLSITDLLSLNFSTETEPAYVWNIVSVTDSTPAWIHLTAAGTLPEEIEGSDISLTMLRITGEINGTDVALLHTLPNLTYLDLSKASVTEGGAAYLRSYTTQKNIVGDSMFVGMPLNQILLPENTERIGNYAFRDCKSLKEAVIPESVTYVGKYAYLNCTSLGTVTFLAADCRTAEPEKGAYHPPFKGCPLASVTFGENTQTIPAALFWDAENSFTFTSLAFPTALTSIGDYAFYNSPALTEVIIPQGVTRLGKSPFYHCTAMSKVVYNATECTASGYREDETVFYPPFEGCKLSSVTIGEEVKTIPAALFWNKSAGFSFVSVRLPNGLQAIEDYAFSGCKLISLIIPEQVTSLGCHAFYKCPLLMRVTYNAADCKADYVKKDSLYYSPFKLSPISTLIIGEKVTSIPEGLFWNSGNSFTFKTLTLPAGLQSIGPRAFRDCVFINTVNCAVPSPLDIEYNVFYTIDLQNCRLTVPSQMRNEYAETFPWNRFGSISEE